MADHSSAIGALSDWYELVQGSELLQGDILEGCPVFRPPEDLPWPFDEGMAEFEFTVGQQDVIVMTQSPRSQPEVGPVAGHPLPPLAPFRRCSGQLVPGVPLWQGAVSSWEYDRLPHDLRVRG
jgi:hypothetical protein